MGSGIQWLIDGDTGVDPMTGVVFARGIDARELAARLGAPEGPGAAPMTDAEILDLDVEGYRPGGSGDGVVRVGEYAGWAFAIEYGDCEGLSRLEEVSRGGTEAVYYSHNPYHPPTIVFYARDGRRICGFGLREEEIRWGEQPDLLVPDLAAARILTDDGAARDEDDGDDADRKRRALSVIEARFGLSLPRTVFTVDRLAVHAVNGAPAPDFDAVRAWAKAQGHPVPDERLGLVPTGLRRSYEHAVHWQQHRDGMAPAPIVGTFHTSGVSRRASE
ncbi:MULTISPECIES: DUF6461 domain-containing protein [Streptomyces]|uniref:DUF6461 domain-containing protein n=1 Tax=Streptomyces TaxID=1883 RepID=UPI00067C9B59|nr:MULTISPECIES: hypothetical protein [Streptomyces]KOT62920.1 hypothetical protein ADK43_09030 [Streptomyces rimosus subsp. rimosus]